MTDQLEQAETLALEAAIALSKLKQKIADEKFEARLKAEGRITKKHADEYDVLRTKSHKAKDTLIKLKNAAASHPLEGRRVKGVIYTGKWGKRKNDVIGLVEVVRTDTVFPQNMLHGKLSIGDVIIRKLKKDGTPSKQFYEHFYARHAETLEGWKLVELTQ